MCAYLSFNTRLMVFNAYDPYLGIGTETFGGENIYTNARSLSDLKNRSVDWAAEIHVAHV